MISVNIFYDWLACAANYILTFGGLDTYFNIY